MGLAIRLETTKENKMILKNPLDNEVKIQLSGIEYSIPAQGTLEVQDSVGEKWMKIHNFLRKEIDIDPKDNSDKLVANVEPQVIKEVEVKKEVKEVKEKITKKPGKTK